MLDPKIRSKGISSRIRQTHGETMPWKIDEKTSFDLPVIVDFIGVSDDNEKLLFKVEATVGLVDGAPTLIAMFLESASGLDTLKLQKEFVWQSPVDIVVRGVPRLLAEGIDPYSIDLPTENFPEAATVVYQKNNALDDDFLEDVAREYLLLGRGYAQQMASAYFVSPRTVVSWVEKARKRGILSTVAKGSVGGEIVPVSKRAAFRREI